MTNALVKFHTRIHSRLSTEKGATAVEYGLLVALIAAIIVGTVATVGQDVLTGFKTVADALP